MSSKGESVHFLERNTSRLICSNQVIIGPYNAVKELVENALDSNATAVEVRLDNFGLDKIEVKDNGKGIRKSDVSSMCLPGHSSKIKEFSDLGCLTTYGFRGEALGALCCVATVKVTTKTANDDVASCYKFDSEGHIIDTKPSHLGQGTTVCVSQIFCHQPARRRMLLTGKGGASLGTSKTATLNQIRSYLGALGVAWTHIRLSLIHNGSLVWRKQAAPTTSKCPMQVALGETLGHNQAANLKFLSTSGKEIQVMIPAIGCKIKDISQSSRASMIIIVNKRVIHHKQLENVILEHVKAVWPDMGRSKFPVCVLELKVEPQDIDVNLEPDKSKLLINADKEAVIIEELRALVSNYYNAAMEANHASEENKEEPCSKRARLDTESEYNTLEGVEHIEWSTTETVTPNSVSLDKNFEQGESSNTEPIESRQAISIEILEAKKDENEENQADINMESFDLSLLEESQGEIVQLTEEDEVALNELEKLYSHPPEQQEVIEVEPKLDLAWSRGQLQTTEGKVIEACSVLAPKVLPVAPTTFSYESSASPSSQMGCRELAGFSLFCKENRSKIVEESPGILFTKVAQILARRWKELPSVEKDRYGELSRELKLNKQMKEFSSVTSPSLNKTPCRPIKVNVGTVGVSSNKASSPVVSGMPRTTISLVGKNDTRTVKAGNPIPRTTISLVSKGEMSILQAETSAVSSSGLVIQKVGTSENNNSTETTDKITKASSPGKPPKKESKPSKIKKEITCNFNLKNIHQKSSIETSSSIVIGKVQGCWLIKHDMEIGLLRPWALREMLLYERLLAELSLPLMPLDMPLQLNSSDLGFKAWQALGSLETQWDVISNKTEISSPLITSNGFRIVITKSESEILNAEVTHITSDVPNFGLSQLTEVLLNKIPCTLAESRPTSIKQHIMNKAVAASAACTDDQYSDIEELLQKWSIKQAPCLHGVNIFTNLHTLSK